MIIDNGVMINPKSQIEDNFEECLDKALMDYREEKKCDSDRCQGAVIIGCLRCVTANLLKRMGKWPTN